MDRERTVRPLFAARTELENLLIGKEVGVVRFSNLDRIYQRAESDAMRRSAPRLATHQKRESSTVHQLATPTATSGPAGEVVNVTAMRLAMVGGETAECVHKKEITTAPDQPTGNGHHR